MRNEEGRMVTKAAKLKSLERGYFTDLFSNKGIRDTSHLLSWVNRCVTDCMNSTLMTEFEAEEVYEALKTMGPTKASREDDFPVLFYQRYWHIIGKNVSDFSLEILNRGTSMEILILY